MEIPYSDPFRFVVVDDDEACCKPLCMQLKYQGFDSIYFTRNLPAVDHFKNHFVDVLILDYHLPSGNGVSLVGNLRRLPTCGDLPVFILTGDASMEILEKCMDAGVAGFFLKPMDFRKFLASFVEMKPAVVQRRELHFLKYLMDIYSEASLTAGQKHKLSQELRKVGIVKRFIEDPTSIPAQTSTKLLQVLNAFLKDVSHQILSGISESDDERVIRTLDLVDQIVDSQDYNRGLKELMRSDNQKIASKAVKIYGKTTSDIKTMIDELARHDERFVANTIESLWHSYYARSAVELFLAYLGSPVPRVKTNCVIGLYLNGQKAEAVEELRRMLVHDDLRYVQSALWACGFLQAPEVMQEVAALATYPLEDIRLRAGKAMELIMAEQKTGA